MNDSPLIPLFGYFALLSLFAVGGANAAIPEMHRIAVEVMHWMSDRQFADIFAIAQVSPGPNVIIVTLIGYHVAGLAGAAWQRRRCAGRPACWPFSSRAPGTASRTRRWRIAIQAGLVPVSLGLIGASAFVLARSADHNIYAGIFDSGDRGGRLRHADKSALDFRGRWLFGLIGIFRFRLATSKGWLGRHLFMHSLGA